MCLYIHDVAIPCYIYGCFYLDDSAAEMESDNAVLDDAVNGKELTSPLPATSDHDFSLAGFLTKCGQIWGARYNHSDNAR